MTKTKVRRRFHVGMVGWTAMGTVGFSNLWTSVFFCILLYDKHINFLYFLLNWSRTKQALFLLHILVAPEPRCTWTVEKTSNLFRAVLDFSPSSLLWSACNRTASHQHLSLSHFLIFSYWVTAKSRLDLITLGPCVMTGSTNAVVSTHQQWRREGGREGWMCSSPPAWIKPWLIFHFPINDRGYNYDISQMQMALIEESGVLTEEEVKVFKALCWKWDQQHLQCGVTERRRHFTQSTLISKALQFSLTSFNLHRPC